MIEEMSQPAPASYSWSQAWSQAFRKPSPATFENLLKDPAATPGRAYKWVFLVTMTIAAWQLMISLVLSQPLTSVAGSNNTSVTTSIVENVVSIPVSGVGAVLGLMFEAWLLQWIANRLGGSGYYDDLVYILAAFEAPLVLISGILAAIPCIGLIAELLIYLYALLLTTIAVRTVNHFSGGKAFLCVVCFTLISLALVVLFAFLGTWFNK